MKNLIKPLKYWFGLAIMLGLSACGPQGVVEEPAPAVSAPVAQSAESQAAARYYRRIEQSLAARGLLRTDGGLVDARYTAPQLAENFERIALYDEYVQQNGRFIRRQTPAKLRRWEDPVRIKLHFGASASPQMRAKDSAQVARYVERLRRITGHSIALTESAESANYHVFVVSVDEQRTLNQTLDRMQLGLPKSTTLDIARQGRHNYCFVYAASGTTHAHIYELAIAVVRTEHPDLMRQACYHEEIAQGLGLANDSPHARPSIFNDDEEFALLTTHDAQLLQMLYDRRLRPGMSSLEARPIVDRIAAEILNASS